MDLEGVAAVWREQHACAVPEPAGRLNVCGDDAGCTVDESGGARAGIKSGGY